MKKLILIFLTIGICISSCIEDDDNSTDDVNNIIGTFEYYQDNLLDDDSSKDVDKIIGTWVNYQDIELDDGYVRVYDPYDIENQSEFLSGGTLKTFFKSETNYITGTWENMNNGTYKFVYLGFTEIVDIDFNGGDEMICRFTYKDCYWGRIK